MCIKILLAIVSSSWITRVISQGVIVEGPSTTVALPGQDVELECNVSSGTPYWMVNEQLYSQLQLLNTTLPGHNINGNNIVVNNIILNDSRNGSEYRCVLLGTPNIKSDPAFLYIAGVPDLVSSISVMLDSVAAKLTLPSIDFSFKLTWNTPNDNFDPIQNYTITIVCDGTGCPVTLTADGNATSIDVMYNTRGRNVSVMVISSNSVGTSDPAIAEIVAPRSIGMVSVKCSAVDVINLCTVTWDPLSYGPNAVKAPLSYLVGYRYFTPSIILESVETMNTTVDVMLPALDSNVFFTVEPRNAFGAGAVLNIFMDEIMSTSVLNTTSNFLNPNVVIEIHDLIVECGVNPTSTADYCEVVAEGPDIVTTSAMIINHTATVTVSGLRCEGTYSIKAGGTMNQTSIGPRLHKETVTAGDCPVIATTMIPVVSLSSQIPVPTDNPDDGDNTGAILGAVIGALFAAILLTVIIFIVVYFFWYRNNQDSQVTASKLQTDKGSTSNKRRQNCEQEMAATSATINYCNNQA